MLVAPPVSNPRNVEIPVISPQQLCEVGRFSVEVQEGELAGPQGVARHVTKSFTAEVASGPRTRQLRTRLRSSEQQRSVFRDDLQSVSGHPQSRDRWWMTNLSTLQNEVRSDANECHEAVGAAEAEWHQQRMQLESAIGAAEAQTGGQ